MGRCYEHEPYNEDDITVIKRAHNLWTMHWERQADDPQDDRNVEFPQVDEKTSWKIFHLAEKGLLASTSHHSILLVNSNNSDVSFYIELVKSPIRGRNCTKVSMRAKKANPDKLKELSQTQAGTVMSMSAENIFLTAHKVLVDMGGYQACCNDCQTYAKSLIKRLNDDGINGDELHEVDIEVPIGDGSSGGFITIVNIVVEAHPA